MNLSIVQTAGLTINSAALGCYISVDGQLCDIITPISSESEENYTEIPMKGQIELVVKDMRKDEVIGAVLRSIESLDILAPIWLELTSAIISQPKLQISLNNCNKQRQKTEKSPTKDQLLNRISELQVSVMDLECKLELKQEENQKEITESKLLIDHLQFSSELSIEQLKIKLSMAFEVIEEMTTQKCKLLSLCEKESQKSQVLEGMLNAYIEKNKDLIAKAKENELLYANQVVILQMRLKDAERSLINERNEKNDREVMIAQLVDRLNYATVRGNDMEVEERIKRMYERLDSSERQKALMEEFLENMQNGVGCEGVCSRCLDLESQVEFYTSTIHSFQEQIRKNTQDCNYLAELQAKISSQQQEIYSLNQVLTEKSQDFSELSQNHNEKLKILNTLSTENLEITQECQELKYRIIELSRSIESLEKDIIELRCQNITAKKLEKIKLDEIDFSLEDYLQAQGIENLFVKLAHGLYIFGSRRVNISIKNDNHLICRTGGGYMPIDQFLKIYQNSEIEELSKYVKKQSLFLSQNSSPARTLHKKTNSLLLTIENHLPSIECQKTDRSFDLKLTENLTKIRPLKDHNFTPLSRRKLH